MNILKIHKDKLICLCLRHLAAMGWQAVKKRHGGNNCGDKTSMHEIFQKQNSLSRLFNDTQGLRAS